MQRILDVVKNKYLLAFIAFVVWMCFFDRYDVSTQHSYYSQKQNLQEQKHFYESEIDRIEKAIYNIQYNPNEIQRVAREKFKMKKNNEDIYVIVDEEVAESKK